ncbi:putative ATP-grasp-modified RiPP [Streptomonospora sp. PA3]|nr:putative ATP-grasp-modified RiPP [Streptomonospora sp. PA3]MUL41586.1 putative ATP-grasp-modified RiPP [Streptomonospora sp. PA3]
MKRNPQDLRPWGLGRMAPYPPSEPLPYAHAELDPHTQTGRYFDASGRPLEAGKHGTNVSQQTQSQTPVGGDGSGPGATRTDTTTDYVQD